MQVVNVFNEGIKTMQCTSHSLQINYKIMLKAVTPV